MRDASTSTTRIADLVEFAFSGDSGRERATAFMSQLQLRMKDVSDASRRTVLLLLLVAALFELVSRAAISAVQVGPIQVKDLALIQKALPVVFAYLVYDEVTLGTRYLYSWAVAREIAKRFDPALRATRLDYLLSPVASSLFGPMDWQSPQGSSTRIAVRFFTTVLRTSSMIVPPIVEAYAFYRLFSTFGTHDPIVWLSLVFSLGFFLYAGVVGVAVVADGLVPVRTLLTSR